MCRGHDRERGIPYRSTSPGGIGPRLPKVEGLRYRLALVRDKRPDGEQPRCGEAPSVVMYGGLSSVREISLLRDFFLVGAMATAEAWGLRHCLR